MDIHKNARLNPASSRRYSSHGALNRLHTEVAAAEFKVTPKTAAKC